MSLKVTTDHIASHAGGTSNTPDMSRETLLHLWMPFLKVYLMMVLVPMVLLHSATISRPALTVVRCSHSYTAATDIILATKSLLLYSGNGILMANEGPYVGRQHVAAKLKANPAFLGPLKGYLKYHSSAPATSWLCPVLSVVGLGKTMTPKEA
jgi:hypothetical protein